MKDNACIFRLGSLFCRASIFFFVVASHYAAAHAATDGTLGPTSTGSLSITITIPPRVRISNVADLALGTFTGTGDKTAADDVCIYTNDPAGTYRVTATGDGTGGAFTVNDGASNELAYSLRWNDQTGTTGNVLLTSGTALTGQSGANTTASDCGGSNTANIEATITESELSLGEAGSYSGNVTILVEPD